MVEIDMTVALLYQAAAGRAAWEGVMELISKHLQLLLAQVIGVDAQARRVLFSFEGGTGSAEATLDYTRTYHRIDPHADFAVTLPVGEYSSFSEAIGDAVAEQHPFYRDYLIPYGGRYVHGAKLYENGSRVVFLGLHRGLGTQPLRGDDVVLARRLVYHLVRACDIYMGLRTTFAEAAFGQALLDRLGSPILILDAQRRVVLRNGPATELVSRHKLLTEDAHGVLRCRIARIDTELGLAMKSLQLSGHGGLDTAAPVDRKIVPIPIDGQARPLVATLMALRPESTMGAFGPHPLVMLVLHDSNTPHAIQPFALSAAFDFTPAEARVASQLANGLKPSEIAALNKVALATTNTHIRAIHDKLGVRRTSEVVAVLHSLAFASLGTGGSSAQTPPPRA